MNPKQLAQPTGLYTMCLHEYTALKSPNIGRNGLSGRLQFSSMPVFAGMGGVCVCVHAFHIRGLYSDTVVYTSVV